MHYCRWPILTKYYFLSQERGSMFKDFATHSQCPLLTMIQGIISLSRKKGVHQSRSLLPWSSLTLTHCIRVEIRVAGEFTFIMGQSASPLNLPKVFKVLSPNSFEVNPSNISRWEHGSWDLSLHTRSQVLSLKYDMNAYMIALFVGEAQGLCWELCLSLSDINHSSIVSWYHVHNLGPVHMGSQVLTWRHNLNRPIRHSR